MKGKKKIIKGSTMSSTAKLKKIQHYLHVNNNNKWNVQRGMKTISNMKIEENHGCNCICNNNNNNDKFQRCNSLYNNCMSVHNRNNNIGVSNGLIKGNTMTHLYNNHNKQNKSSNINVYKNEFGLGNKQQCEHKRVNSFNNVPINTNPNTLLLTIPIRHEHYNTQQYNINNNNKMNKNKTKQISFNYNIREVCSSLKDKTTQTHNAIIEPEHVSYFPTEISNINSVPFSKQTPNDNNNNNNNNSYCETTETHMLANMLTIQDNNNNNNIHNIKQQKDPTLNMQSILTKTFNILHKQPQHHKSRNAFSTENKDSNNNNNKEQSIHSKRNFTFGEISIIPHKTTNQNTQTKNSIIDTLWPPEQHPLPNYHPTPKPISYYNIKHNYYTINSFKIREAHFKKTSTTRHPNNINLNIKHHKKYCRTTATTTSPLNKEYCYKCKQTQSQYKTLEHIIPRMCMCVLPKQP